LLTNLISKAQESVVDKWDANEIFVLLQKWAREKPQSAPLIGTTEEGVQWLNSEDQPCVLSIKNLRDRLRRQRKSSQVSLDERAKTR
jgi:hypothetical protein